MLASLAVLGAGFAWSIARAYRRQRVTPGAFQPEGKLRWSEPPEA
jgi:hypothetical protein